MRQRGQAGTSTTEGIAGTPAEADKALYKPEEDDDRIPKMGGGWERIITTVFTLDERKAFEELTDALEFDGPAHRKEYGELLDELDRAAGRTLKASALVVNAEVALDRYLAQTSQYMAEMHETARQQLEKEKSDRDGKGKAITNDDVQARMARIYGDEFVRVRERKAKAEGAVKQLKALEARWIDRSRHLEAMVRTTRKV